jgi:hypothetical protein
MAFEVLFSYSIFAVIGAALLVGERAHFGAGLVTLGVGLTLVGASVLAAQRLLTAGNAATLYSSWWGKIRRRALRFVVGITPFTLRDTIWAVTVYGIYCALQLVFITLIAASFADLSLTQGVIIAGAWGVSLTLGWLSFLAPVGLGVRDGLAFVLFSQVLDAPTASLIVATSRIVMIVADLTFVGVVELLVLGISFKQTQPQTSP